MGIDLRLAFSTRGMTVPINLNAFYDQFKCIFAFYLAIYVVSTRIDVTVTRLLCKQYYATQSSAIFIAILKKNVGKKSKKSK